MAALSICEVLLFALNDAQVLPENEIMGVLEDAAASHENAEGSGDEVEMHSAVDTEDHCRRKLCQEAIDQTTPCLSTCLHVRTGTYGKLLNSSWRPKSSGAGASRRHPSPKPDTILTCVSP